MGMWFTYISSDEVNPDHRTIILQETADFQERRLWWCEPIDFFNDPKNPKRLSGGNKIFLIGYSSDDGGLVDVDPGHEILMALRDTLAIIEELKFWSHQYGISWRLQIAGEDIGLIEGGILDSEVNKYIEGEQENLVDLGITDISNPAIVAIDKQYSTRWEDDISGDLFYSPHGNPIFQEMQNKYTGSIAQALANKKSESYEPPTLTSSPSLSKENLVFALCLIVGVGFFIASLLFQDLTYIYFGILLSFITAGALSINYVRIRTAWHPVVKAIAYIILFIIMLTLLFTSIFIFELVTK